MIASLTGRVAELGASSVVLDLQGVGWLVQVTPTHALALRHGETASISIRTIVREDAFLLYGFRDAAEREVFDLLIGISGVGPKSALGIIAQLEPAELARAVDEDDDAAFKRVSGVGPKTAKLIILQLKGKLRPAAPAVAAPAPVAPSVRDDVIEALVGLGTAAKPAAAAVDAAIAVLGDEVAEQSVPDLLRAALRQLGARG